MDEYITWSDELKQFSDNITLKELLKDVCETWDVYEVEEGKYFRNIGLKDTNGKSIYADSSIVEFEFGTISNKKLKGYFKYSNYTLGYHIVLVDDRNRGRAFRFDADLMHDIKIIDTIQENKLGLIKNDS